MVTEQRINGELRIQGPLVNENPQKAIPLWLAVIGYAIVFPLIGLWFFGFLP